MLSTSHHLHLPQKSPAKIFSWMMWDSNKVTRQILQVALNYGGLSEGAHIVTIKLNKCFVFLPNQHIFKEATSTKSRKLQNPVMSYWGASELLSHTLGWSDYHDFHISSWLWMHICLCLRTTSSTTCHLESSLKY
jgi:hypothetical protein